jgi:hypothetical protein
VRVADTQEHQGKGLAFETRIRITVLNLLDRSASGVMLCRDVRAAHARVYESVRWVELQDISFPLMHWSGISDAAAHALVNVRVATCAAAEVGGRP